MNHADTYITQLTMPMVNTWEHAYAEVGTTWRDSRLSMAIVLRDLPMIHLLTLSLKHADPSM